VNDEDFFGGVEGDFTFRAGEGGVLGGGAAAESNLFRHGFGWLNG
jgi:hypothetical protein